MRSRDKQGATLAYPTTDPEATKVWSAWHAVEIYRLQIYSYCVILLVDTVITGWKKTKHQDQQEERLQMLRS